MAESVKSNDWQGTERRHCPRLPIVTNLRIRAESTLHNVYTRDVSSYGVSVSVRDSSVFKRNHLVQAVFVIASPKKTLYKLDFRKARVAWSAGGRVGLEFTK